MEINDLPKKLHPIAWHGVNFIDESGDNYYGECPFCEEEKFYANPDTGQWDCKKCHKSGNVYGFLEEYHRYCLELTTKSQLRRVSEWRGLPMWVLRANEMAFDENNKRYMLPIRNPKGTVQDIRTCRYGRQWRSTRGCDVGLMGLADLLAMEDGVVYLCGGEWDKMAMQAMLKEAESEAGGVAVGVPGETVFKGEWTPWFKRKKVRLCYDHDDGGDQGMARVGGCEGYPKENSTLRKGILRGVAKSIEYIHWPAIKKDGYDINDHYKQHMLKTGAKKLGLLEGYFEDFHPRTQRLDIRRMKKLVANGRPLPSGEGIRKMMREEETPPYRPRSVVGRVKRRLSFDGVVRRFKKWVEMSDETVLKLKLIYATVLSIRITGDPVWIYIVGPPGDGKTMLIETCQDSECVEYLSSLTPHVLVSGWILKGGGDPSLLPLLDGRCLMLKDFTEILQMREADRKEIEATLRGAYDGHYTKTFGNGMTRDYESHFSMVAGVTPVIHGRTAEGAAMGERFLKVQSHESVEGNRAKVMSAIEGIPYEEERDAFLRETSRRFIDKRMGKVDPLKYRKPAWFNDKMYYLVDLLVHLRAVVERNYKGDIRYRPGIEVGTRLAKQLTKLGYALCEVEDKVIIDWDIFKILRRVAFDTTIGFSFDVVKVMMKLGGRKLRIDQISEASGLPMGVVREKLDDLMLLKVVTLVRSEDGGSERLGRRKYLWSVARPIRKRWEMVEDLSSDEED